MSGIPLLGNKGRNENVLFNDALNTCYLRLYGVGHTVKAHSEVTLSDWQQEISYMYHPTNRIVHTTAFVTHVN